MREGRYIYFHGDGNPGVEFDGFSHGSGSEAGDSEDEDSGEVGTGLQVRVSIAPVINQVHYLYPFPTTIPKSPLHEIGKSW